MVKNSRKTGQAPDPRIDLQGMALGQGDALHHACRVMNAYYDGDLTAFLEAYKITPASPVSDVLKTYIAGEPVKDTSRRQNMSRPPMARDDYIRECGRKLAHKASAKRLGFKVTYDVITDESAIAGDVAALGWIDPKTGAQCDDMPDTTGLRAALDLLNPVGYSGNFLESMEQDSSDPKSTKSIRWIWRVYGVKKGGATVVSETRTLHFPKSATPATRARLVSLLTEC